MTTSQLPIYGSDVRWNMDVLHLIGHPVPASQWHVLEDEREAGWTPEQAADASYPHSHYDWDTHTWVEVPCS